MSRTSRAISATLPLTRRGLPLCRRIYLNITGRWRGTYSQEFIIPRGKYVSCRRIVVFNRFRSVIVADISSTFGLRQHLATDIGSLEQYPHWCAKFTQVRYVRFNAVPRLVWCLIGSCAREREVPHVGLVLQQ